MKPEILIGMGGWMLPSFEGTFYPADAGKGFRKLQYYSRFFDMVEVNATFYTPRTEDAHMADERNRRLVILSGPSCVGKIPLAKTLARWST